MKIVVLSDSYPPYHTGGAEHIAALYARECAQRGHEVTVLTTVQEKDRAGESHDNRITVVRWYVPAYARRWQQYRGLINWRVWRLIQGQLERIRPDIVHAHNVHQYLSWAALLVAKSYARSVVYHAHDVMAFHAGKLERDPVNGLRTSWWRELRGLKWRFNPLYRPLVRWVISRVALRVAVSEALSCALQANGIEPVITVHNGIDPHWGEVPLEDVEHFRDEHHLQGMQTVLIAGRLGGAKGGGIISPLAKSLADMPQVRFLVAGRDVPESLRMDQHIIALGWLNEEQMKLVYHCADVVLVPSLYEDPFPTVNLEAMACARPVVGTIFGGTGEVVQDGVTGYLIDPNDIAVCAEKIRMLLADEALRLQFGGAGKQWIQDHFTLVGQTDQLLELFEASLRT